MIPKTKEMLISYYDRSSPGISGMILIHVGDILRSIDLLKHEEGTKRKLQRICNHMEKCGIIGLITPHQSRGKFYIRGRFSLFVLWHVGCQCFVEFENLMYSVGKIEDGIKKGKIVFTRASMIEKNIIISDEHVQAMFREKGSKRKSHMTRDETVNNFSHSSS